LFNGTFSCFKSYIRLKSPPPPPIALPEVDNSYFLQSLQNKHIFLSLDTDWDKNDHFRLLLEKNIISDWNRNERFGQFWIKRSFRIGIEMGVLGKILEKKVISEPKTGLINSAIL
jgi:hypothetical protein